MADNVGYTPGTGATIAADEIGGVLHQRIKIGIGGDGVAADVSAANPMPVVGYGEMIDQLAAIRVMLGMLLGAGVGVSMPDTAGRLRVNAEATNITGGTLPTVTTVGAVTALGNQTNIGGLSATPQVPAIMQFAESALRANITVT